jgi:3-phosphoglycerate kinase
MHYLKALDLKDKNVLLRLDLDLPENENGYDTTRLDMSIPTINSIIRKVAKLHIIGHLGRPEGKKVKKLDLAPIHKLLLERIDEQHHAKITFGENLRFDPGEEGNSKEFAKKLAKGFDVYVNDAFAVAHREHASVVTLPTLLPTVMGRQFEKEIKVLRQIVYAPRRPLTLVLGGAKEDKLEYLERLFDRFNVQLLGGALAHGRKDLEQSNRKLIVADLTDDGMDLTQEAMEQFDRFIKASETVVWNGPVGKYEDGIHDAGTKYIANSLAKSKIYSVLCGGDTEAAITLLGYKHEDFNHVSTGGGSTMEYLVNGTVPGFKAIEESQAKFEWDKLLEFVV